MMAVWQDRKIITVFQMRFSIVLYLMFFFVYVRLFIFPSPPHLLHHPPFSSSPSLCLTLNLCIPSYRSTSAKTASDDDRARPWRTLGRANFGDWSLFTPDQPGRVSAESGRPHRRHSEPPRRARRPHRPSSSVILRAEESQALFQANLPWVAYFHAYDRFEDLSVFRHIIYQYILHHPLELGGFFVCYAYATLEAGDFADWLDGLLGRNIVSEGEHERVIRYHQRVASLGDRDYTRRYLWWLVQFVRSRARDEHPYNWRAALTLLYNANYAGQPNQARSLPPEVDFDLEDTDVDNAERDFDNALDQEHDSDTNMSPDTRRTNRAANSEDTPEPASTRRRAPARASTKPPVVTPKKNKGKGRATEEDTVDDSSMPPPSTGRSATKTTVTQTPSKTPSKPASITASPGKPRSKATSQAGSAKASSSKRPPPESDADEPEHQKPVTKKRHSSYAEVSQRLKKVAKDGLSAAEKNVDPTDSPDDELDHEETAAETDDYAPHETAPEETPVPDDASVIHAEMNEDITKGPDGGPVLTIAECDKVRTQYPLDKAPRDALYRFLPEKFEIHADKEAECFTNDIMPYMPHWDNVAFQSSYAGHEKTEVKPDPLYAGGQVVGYKSNSRLPVSIRPWTKAPFYEWARGGGQKVAIKRVVLKDEFANDSGKLNILTEAHRLTHNSLWELRDLRDQFAADMSVWRTARRAWEVRHAKNVFATNPSAFEQNVTKKDIAGLDKWLSDQMVTEQDGSLCAWFTGRGPHLPSQLWNGSPAEEVYDYRTGVLRENMSKLNQKIMLLQDKENEKSNPSQEPQQLFFPPEDDTDEEDHANLWDFNHQDYSHVACWVVERHLSWTQLCREEKMDLQKNDSAWDYFNVHRAPLWSTKTWPASHYGIDWDNTKTRHEISSELPWGLPAEALRTKIGDDEALLHQFFAAGMRNFLLTFEHWYHQLSTSTKQSLRLKDITEWPLREKHKKILHDNMQIDF